VRRTQGGVYSYSADTIEGPRAPAVTVKLTARHSSQRERERDLLGNNVHDGG